jgi:hypothetical protein
LNLPPEPRLEKSPAIFAGRNCEVFDRVRKWGYKDVRGFKAEGDEQTFADVIATRVRTENRALADPMEAFEERSIAKSIAGWTWRVYRSGNPEAPARRQAASRARTEARKAQRAAAKRSRSDLAEAVAERRRLVIGHWNLRRSTADIARLVHVSIRTVQRLVALVEGAVKPATHAAAASGNILPSSVSPAVEGANFSEKTAANFVFARLRYKHLLPARPPAERESPELAAAQRIGNPAARAAFLTALAAFRGG